VVCEVGEQRVDAGVARPGKRNGKVPLGGGEGLTPALALARLRGVQVPFCALSVIAMQQLPRFYCLGGPTSRDVNWPF
jgi:hypothetical protein